MSKLNSPGVASFLLFLALFAYRVLNAWTVKTYFNPDEYWQGPEVAHKLVFGSGLLTWEWESERIRSFIHPLLFAVFYALLKVTNLASRGAVAYGPSMVVQAFLTASTDLHVYWLAKRVMMQGSGDGDDAIARAETIARCALFCQCSNWFMWYAGVRTFSSSLEMALLVPAVYHWVALVERAESIEGGNQKSLRYLPPSRVGMTEPLSIVLGTVSIMVRPTALFAWVPLGFWRLSCTRLYDIPQYLLRVVLFWTALVMLVSTLLDSYCYNRVSLLDQARNAGPGAHPTVSTVPQWEWVFTPVNFLRINLVAGVAVQYGSHPFHWYFTLGALTVLTTQLPFVLLGLRRALSRNRFSVWSPFSVVDFRPTALCLLALVVLTYPLGLSLSPHKEFRFLLPVLPFAHVLAGVVISEQVMFPRHEIVARSCGVAETKISAAPRTWRGGRKPRFFLLSILFLATTHAPMAFYFSRIHQRGPIDVMQFLSSLLAEDAKGMGRGATRETGQHEGSEGEGGGAGGGRGRPEVVIDFLMPCHATPWTTHLHVPAYFMSSSSPICADNVAPSFFLGLSSYLFPAFLLPPSIFSASTPSTSIVPPPRLLLRHLDCPPVLRPNTPRPNPTEAFLIDPLGYAMERYSNVMNGASRGISPYVNAKSDDGDDCRTEREADSLSPPISSPSLPDYIVTFGSAARELDSYLIIHKGYEIKASLFHSSFRGDMDSPRHEDSIVVFGLNHSVRTLPCLSGFGASDQ